MLRLVHSAEFTRHGRIEEGILYAEVRRKWWQFWLPKRVMVGRYNTIGEVTTLWFHADGQAGCIIGRATWTH